MMKTGMLALRSGISGHTALQSLVASAYLRPLMVAPMVCGRGASSLAANHRLESASGARHCGIAFVEKTERRPRRTGKLWASQTFVPRLPLPTLENTMEKYLEAIGPIVGRGETD